MVSESQYGIVGLRRFADGDAAELPLSAVGALCRRRVQVFGGCCNLWEALEVSHPCTLAASSQTALFPFRVGRAPICSFALEQAFAVLGRSRTSRVPLQPVEQEANATSEC